MSLSEILMSRSSPPLPVDGSASRKVGPSTTTVVPGAHLRLVAGRDEPMTQIPGALVSTTSVYPNEASFARLKRQLLIASQLGIDPLTVAERAQSLLTATCAGWRHDRRCTSSTSTVLRRPHDTCVLAQYHHDLLLLDHGLLDPTVQAATPLQPTGASSPGRSPRRKRTAG